MLQRAINDPDFQRLATEQGFKLPHIQNWIRNHEVPATFRAGMRSILSTWSRTHPQPTLR